jgi:hypothetical protein
MTGRIIDLFPKPPSPYTWERYEAAIEEIERQRVFTRRTIAISLSENGVGYPYSTANVAIGVLRAAGLIRQTSPADGKPQVFALTQLLAERSAS